VTWTLHKGTGFRCPRSRTPGGRLIEGPFADARAVRTRLLERKIETKTVTRMGRGFGMLGRQRDCSPVRRQVSMNARSRVARLRVPCCPKFWRLRLQQKGHLFQSVDSKVRSVELPHERRSWLGRCLWHASGRGDRAGERRFFTPAALVGNSAAIRAWRVRSGGSSRARRVLRQVSRKGSGILAPIGEEQRQALAELARCHAAEVRRETEEYWRTCISRSWMPTEKWLSISDRH